MNGANRLPNAILRSPLTWGSFATLAFYAAIHSGTLHGEFVVRYFGSHPVEYVAAAAFFVGLAALAIKTVEAVRQLILVGNQLLEEPPRGGQSLDECSHLIGELDSLPTSEWNTLLVQRVRAGIEHVVRNQTADELEDELKYLAELDAERAHNNYSLVRLIIWAIPILGFLGTVVGITLAIANLSPDALESSLPEVTAGLGVAFDTTAMALGLSIVLMFAQFLADRTEQHLLAAVDRRTGDELLGRFAKSPEPDQPQLAVLRRMAESVIASTERLVERQAELWRSDDRRRASTVVATLGYRRRTTPAIVDRRAGRGAANRVGNARRGSPASGDFPSRALGSRSGSAFQDRRGLGHPATRTRSTRGDAGRRDPGHRAGDLA